MHPSLRLRRRLLLRPRLSAPRCNRLASWWKSRFLLLRARSRMGRCAGRSSRSGSRPSGRTPGPEPLPATVAEAGVLAVERIAHLQEELTQARTLNLALTQDLESTRRQSERATEEARSRMEEARRLASEMEGRAK